RGGGRGGGAARCRLPGSAHGRGGRVTVSTITAVTLTRRRHPFEGRSLRVLGSMRRHGAAELLVVLPDGSKRLIPAAWTDLEQPPGVTDAGDGLATLGSVPDLLGL